MKYLTIRKESKQVEAKSEILECGCERIYINGRYILIPCDKHDKESHPPKEIHFTKYKKCIMDNI